VRAELTKRLEVKRPSIRARGTDRNTAPGHDRNTAPEYLDVMGVAHGPLQGATAEKAVPFPASFSLADQSGGHRHEYRRGSSAGRRRRLGSQRITDHQVEVLWEAETARR
jgi:hypothetical protein